MFDTLTLEALVTMFGVGVIAMTHYAPTDRRYVINHSLRKQIVEYVKGHPATTKKEIRIILGSSRSTIEHHVNILHKADIIYSMREAGKDMLFHAEVEKNTARVWALMKQKPAMKIAHILVDKPGLTQSEIIKVAKSSRKVLCPYIKKFVDLHLVQEARTNGCCHYTPRLKLFKFLKCLEGNESTKNPKKS